MINIFLDPGHGFEKPGAVYGDIEEADYVEGFCLDVADVFEVGLYYKTDLCKLFLSRDCVQNPTFKERAKIAKEVDADCTISIHLNANENSAQLHGTEIYYRSARDIPITNAFEKGMSIGKYFKAKPDDWTSRAHNVIKRYECPAFLIELAYLTNEEDYKALQNPVRRGKMVLDFCKGILNIVEQLEKEKGK